MVKKCFKDALYEYFLNGCKNKEEGSSIGVEIEHFVVKKKDGQMVSYYGDRGIREILECLAVFYDERIMLNGQLVGLKRSTDIISLEPAGQIEISIAKQKSISAVLNIYRTFYKQITNVIGRWDYALLNVGYYEDATGKSPKLIPKERYQYMDAYFEKIGPYGEKMMRRTASVHVSVDYFDEVDFEKKYLTAYVLSPILSLMFENNGTSLGEGQDNYLVRTQIWNATDSKRVDVAPFMKNGRLGFSEYIDFLKQIPVIVYPYGDKMLPSSDTLEKIWDKSICADKAQEQELLEHLLSMAFPAVRLKHYIEIRTADSMVTDMLETYLNIIFYIFNNIDEFYPYVLSLLEMNSHFTEDAINAMKKDGMEAIVLRLDKIGEKIKISDVIKKIIDIYTRNRVREITMQHSAKVESPYVQDASDYQDSFVASGANYKGNNLFVGYVPKLFSTQQCKVIKEAATMMEGIMEKIIIEYIKNPEYRKLFNFDEKVAELILRMPSYKCVLPVTRVDIFLDEKDDSYKLCELNTDGTSAMYEDRQSAGCFTSTLLYQDLTKEFDLSSYELFDTLAEEFLQNYATVKGCVDKPHVVVTDFLEKGCSMEEFEHFAKSFAKQGATAEVCEIRNLKRIGNALYAESGNKIDLIYRRAVTSDLIPHLDEVDDFITSVINGEVVLMGDFCTQIVHDKRLFVLFGHEMTRGILTEDECAYLDAYIPKTFWLTRENADEYRIREYKDRYILKPTDSYGSYGIYPGYKLSSGEWNDVIDDLLNKGKGEYGSYIVQEFVTPYKTYNIIKSDIEDNGSDKEICPMIRKSNLTGLYVYCGKFYGVYSRQARGEVISSLYDESLIPTFSVLPKNLPDALKNLLLS